MQEKSKGEKSYCMLGAVGCRMKIRIVLFNMEQAAKASFPQVNRCLT